MTTTTVPQPLETPPRPAPMLSGSLAAGADPAPAPVPTEGGAGLCRSRRSRPSVHPRESLWPGEACILTRLEAFRPLVRATARRWAGGTNRSGVDEEDLAQEITLALWLRLQGQPDMTPGQMAFKAKDAAREALRRGPSVERNVVRKGQRRWRMESLDVLMDEEERWTDFEADLIARRHGDPADGNVAFSPVEDLALARVLYQQLREQLTPKQREVLELRLQGYSLSGIAALWGISSARVHAFMTRIRKKARDLWEEPAPPSEALFATTDDLARELGLSRIRASNLCKEGKVVGAQRVGKRWLIPRPIQVVPYPRWHKR